MDALDDLARRILADPTSAAPDECHRAVELARARFASATGKKWRSATRLLVQVATAGVECGERDGARLRAYMSALIEGARASDAPHYAPKAVARARARLHADACPAPDRPDVIGRVRSSSIVDPVWYELGDASLPPAPFAEAERIEDVRAGRRAYAGVSSAEEIPLEIRVVRDAQVDLEPEERSKLYATGESVVVTTPTGRLALKGSAMGDDARIEVEPGSWRVRFHVLSNADVVIALARAEPTTNDVRLLDFLAAWCA